MLSQIGSHGNSTSSWSSSSSCCYSGSNSGLKIGHSNLGRTVNGVEECPRATRDNMRQGADHIKTFTSGGFLSETDRLESVQFTLEEIKAITITRNMGGTLVTAHAYTAEAVRHAIEGGARGIEHGNMIHIETARLMADVGCFLTPTLALHTFVTIPPYDKFKTPRG